MQKVELYIKVCSEQVSPAFGNTLLATGAKIKYWKPNLLQRLMYRICLMKDPRYNGKKLDWYLLDEVGTWR